MDEDSEEDYKNGNENSKEISKYLFTSHNILKSKNKNPTILKNTITLKNLYKRK